MLIYEGYFNNIDNEVDTDDLEMTSSLEPDDNEHLFKFTISTLINLPVKNEDEEELDKRIKQRSYSECSRYTLSVVNSIFNAFELCPIIKDYRFFIIDNDKPVVSSFNKFKEFLDSYIETSMKESIDYRTAHPDINWDNKYFYQFPKFAIGAIFETTLSYKKTYEKFHHLCQRCINTIHKFSTGSTINIDNYNIYSAFNNSDVIEDVFNDLFKDIKGQKSDISSPLNLQYVEPLRVTATFLKKAHPYKTYLCIDKTGKIALTTKPDNGKIESIIGICIDTSVDSDNKMTATFCPFRYGSIERPDTGTVSYRHIKFCNDYYDFFEDNKTDSIDGIKNTKILYDVANKYASENNQYDSNWNKGSISNVDKKGYFPVLNTIYRFHTLGTKQGNWYLGSPDEIAKALELENNEKLHDKLWSDLYEFGISNTFSVTNAFEYATSNVHKSDDCNLLYVDYVEIRDNSININSTLSTNSFVVLPLLKLTQR